MAYGTELDSFRRPRSFIFGTEHKRGLEDIRSDYQSMDNIKPNMAMIWQYNDEKTRDLLLGGQFMMLLCKWHSKIFL